MKNLLNNLFRKDLNLQKYWWHRLLVVIFFICLIYMIYAVSRDLFVNNFSNVIQWKVIDSIENRLTPEVKQIRDLKKYGEQVEEKDRSYAINSGDESLYDDFYCSTELENKIQDIQNKSGITNLYLGRKNTSIENFTKYISDNNIVCLIPDAYTYSDNTKIRFLEPLGSNPLYGKDLVFFKESVLLTGLYITKVFLYVIAVFAIIALIYYKAFLFIIFGNKKKDN